MSADSPFPHPASSTTKDNSTSLECEIRTPVCKYSPELQPTRSGCISKQQTQLWIIWILTSALCDNHWNPLALNSVLTYICSGIFRQIMHIVHKHPNPFQIWTSHHPASHSLISASQCQLIAMIPSAACWEWSEDAGADICSHQGQLLLNHCDCEPYEATWPYKTVWPAMSMWHPAGGFTPIWQMASWINHIWQDAIGTSTPCNPQRPLLPTSWCLPRLMPISCLRQEIEVNL